MISDSLMYNIRDYEVENVEDYVPNGLHPVTIGDYLASGRYRIIQKLGSGGSSIVWLARDLSPPQYGPSSSRIVSVKTMAARETSRLIDRTTHSSLLIPLTLKQVARDLKSPVYDWVQSIEDHFMETGPNGTHLCLVSPLAGPTLFTLASYNMQLRFEVAKGLTKQVCSVVALMHVNGFVHGGK